MWGCVCFPKEFWERVFLNQLELRRRGQLKSFFGLLLIRKEEGASYYCGYRLDLAFVYYFVEPEKVFEQLLILTG
jgi:hypothetical protein